MDAVNPVHIKSFCHLLQDTSEIIVPSELFDLFWGGLVAGGTCVKFVDKDQRYISLLRWEGEQENSRNFATS